MKREIMAAVIVVVALAISNPGPERIVQIGQARIAQDTISGDPLKESAGAFAAALAPAVVEQSFYRLNLIVCSVYLPKVEYVTPLFGVAGQIIELPRSNRHAQGLDPSRDGRSWP